MVSLGERSVGLLDRPIDYHIWPRHCPCPVAEMKVRWRALCKAYDVFRVSRSPAIYRCPAAHRWGALRESRTHPYPCLFWSPWASPQTFRHALESGRWWACSTMPTQRARPFSCPLLWRAAMLSRRLDLQASRLLAFRIRSKSQNTAEMPCQGDRRPHECMRVSEYPCAPLAKVQRLVNDSW